MIQLKGVDKTFFARKQSNRVLKGIDITIGEGEVVAVCGPSGAGKSTLLHIMGLMEVPSAGEVLLFGLDTKALSTAARADLRNRNIGFMFQFHYLVSDFTVRENLLLPFWIKRGYTSSEDSCSSLASLDALGIEELIGRYPSELSGGEQQRVALARALINEPRLILADEPTGNLDKENGDLVIQLLFDEAIKRNMTVVMVTHEPEIAKKTGRTIYMENGILRQAHGLQAGRGAI